MKITHILATASLAAILLAGCQPPAATTEETPAAEQAIEPTPAATPEAATLPCGVLAQRNWTAVLASGSSPTLTVAGEIDLGTPGYSVSLARNAASAATPEPTLNLELRAPTGVVPQVVTAHPIRYFGPAGGQYTTVHVMCEGSTLTDVAVTH